MSASGKPDNRIETSVTRRRVVAASMGVLAAPAVMRGIVGSSADSGPSRPCPETGTFDPKPVLRPAWALGSS